MTQLDTSVFLCVCVGVFDATSVIGRKREKICRSHSHRYSHPIRHYFDLKELLEPVRRDIISTLECMPSAPWLKARGPTAQGYKPASSDGCCILGLLGQTTAGYSRYHEHLYGLATLVTSAGTNLATNQVAPPSPHVTSPPYENLYTSHQHHLHTNHTSQMKQICLKCTSDRFI
ncbi:hypothetical protein BJ741DRAFT_594855 [Chytriomyces cf. hyalinus JEL632]|nr:hypothetical protein BJ741DRAFT_594855 [Chytriomyces cf. hyalinus JEL632]